VLGPSQEASGPGIAPICRPTRGPSAQVSTQPILPVVPIPTQKDRRTRELRRPSPNPLYPTAKPDRHLRPVGGFPRRCPGGRPPRASPPYRDCLCGPCRSIAARAPPPIRHRVKAPPMVPGRHLTARLVRASGQKRTGRWRRARRVNEPRRQDLAGAARQCLSSRLIDAARSLRRAPSSHSRLVRRARSRLLLGALRGDALQKGVTGPAAVQFRGKAFPPKTLFPARAQKRLVLKL
jgi:hypothetical protein